MEYCPLNAFELFLIVVVFVFLIYRKLSANVNFWKNRGVKGPKGWPIFGNILDNFRKPIQEVELERYKKYGPIYGYMQFSNPFLTIADPELIKQITIKDFTTVPNRTNRMPGDPLFSKVMMFLPHEEWRVIRSVLNSAFTAAKLKRMFPMMDTCAENTLNYLQRLTETGEEVNLQKVFGANSFDTIAMCTLGMITNIHQNPHHDLVVNAEQFLNFNSWRIFAVLLLPEKLQKIFGLQMTPETVLQYFRKLMNFVINDRKEKKAVNNDILQALLNVETDDCVSSETKNETTDTFKDVFEDSMVNINVKSDKKLTIDEIIVHSITVLNAGYHTTTLLLSYCFYALTLHEEIQEKLFNELKINTKNGEEMSYEIINSLVYLDAFINETLRFYPPAVNFDRVVDTDYRLKNTNIVVPKGTTLNFSIYPIHHDPQYFPNPDVFSVERFLPENRSNIKPYTFIPFGSGPRICVGLRLSIIETKLCLAKVLLKYRFKKTTNTVQTPLFNSKSHVLLCKPLFAAVEQRM